jgi:hypothetical protein
MDLPPMWTGLRQIPDSVEVLAFSRGYVMKPLPGGLPGFADAPGLAEGQEVRPHYALTFGRD